MPRIILYGTQIYTDKHGLLFHNLNFNRENTKV